MLLGPRCHAASMNAVGKHSSARGLGLTMVARIALSIVRRKLAGPVAPARLAGSRRTAKPRLALLRLRFGNSVRLCASAIRRFCTLPAPRHPVTFRRLSSPPLAPGKMLDIKGKVCFVTPVQRSGSKPQRMEKTCYLSIHCTTRNFRTVIQHSANSGC